MRAQAVGAVELVGINQLLGSAAKYCIGTLFIFGNDEYLRLLNRSDDQIADLGRSDTTRQAVHEHPANCQQRRRIAGFYVRIRRLRLGCVAALSAKATNHSIVVKPIIHDLPFEPLRPETALFARYVPPS